MAKENLFKRVNWGEAPEWANYWTCDISGALWHEDRPYFGNSYWDSDSVQDTAPSFGFNLFEMGYESSLVPHPVLTTTREKHQSSQPSGFLKEKDRPVQNPHDQKDCQPAEPTEDASWIWCKGAKNSGGCFATEAEAARDAVKHSNSSETFYVAQVTRVIKPFKRSATA